MRLIDADALKGQVLETIKVYKTNGKFDEPLARFCKMLKEEIKAIDNAPTIDAEPVVRCKDCRHGETMKTKLAGRITAVFCYKYKHERFMTGSDYCSYGERKE